MKAEDRAEGNLPAALRHLLPRFSGVGRAGNVGLFPGQLLTSSPPK